MLSLEGVLRDDIYSGVRSDVYNLMGQLPEWGIKQKGLEGLSHPLPYIMRDISCWESEHKDFYTDLAAYCNQAAMFKKLTFEEFLNKRHTKQERIKGSLNKWNNSEER